VRPRTRCRNPAGRTLLIVGRQELSVFAHLDRLWFLYRMIEPPPIETPRPPLPAGHLADSAEAALTCLLAEGVRVPLSGTHDD